MFSAFSTLASGLTSTVSRAVFGTYSREYAPAADAAAAQPGPEPDSSPKIGPHPAQGILPENEVKAIEEAAQLAAEAIAARDRIQAEQAAELERLRQAQVGAAARAVGAAGSSVVEVKLVAEQQEQQVVENNAHHAANVEGDAESDGEIVEADGDHNNFGVEAIESDHEQGPTPTGSRSPQLPAASSSLSVTSASGSASASVLESSSSASITSVSSQAAVSSASGSAEPTAATSFAIPGLALPPAAVSGAAASAANHQHSSDSDIEDSDHEDGVMLRKKAESKPRSESAGSEQDFGFEDIKPWNTVESELALEEALDNLLASSGAKTTVPTETLLSIARGIEKFPGAYQAFLDSFNVIPESFSTYIALAKETYQQYLANISNKAAASAPIADGAGEQKGARELHEVKLNSEQKGIDVTIAEESRKAAEIKIQTAKEAEIQRLADEKRAREAKETEDRRLAEEKATKEREAKEAAEKAAEAKRLTDEEAARDTEELKGMAEDDDAIKEGLTEEAAAKPQPNDESIKAAELEKQAQREAVLRAIEQAKLEAKEREEKAQREAAEAEAARQREVEEKAKAAELEIKVQRETLLKEIERAEQEAKQLAERLAAQQQAVEQKRLADAQALREAKEREDKARQQAAEAEAVRQREAEAKAAEAKRLAEEQAAREAKEREEKTRQQAAEAEAARQREAEAKGVAEKQAAREAKEREAKARREAAEMLARAPANKGSVINQGPSENKPKVEPIRPCAVEAALEQARIEKQRAETTAYMREYGF